MIKQVLKNLSNTQRIVVEQVNIKGEDRVEIKKEYRKNIDIEWASSKGITIPVESIPKLVTILKDMTNKGVGENE
jgi:hypothetical protein